MTTLIKAELRKMLTIRTTGGLLLTAAAITTFFTSLEAARAGRRVAPVSTVSGLSTVTTGTGMAMVLAAVLGVIVTTGEFRHGSATLTYLATPRRGRVLVAKCAAVVPIGAIYGVVCGVAATVVGLIDIAAHSDHVALSTATIVGHIVGAGVGAAFTAVIGVAVGSLVRSQLAAVIGVFVWCMILESILGTQVHAVRPYLPYTAASTLGGAKLGAAAFGPGYEVSTQAALPFLAAAALLLAIIGVASYVASRTTVRADIT